MEQELQAPPEAQVLTLTSICCVVLAFDVSCHTQSSVFLAGGNGDTGPTGGTSNVNKYCVATPKLIPNPASRKRDPQVFYSMHGVDLRSCLIILAYVLLSYLLAICNLLMAGPTGSTGFTCMCL